MPASYHLLRKCMSLRYFSLCQVVTYYSFTMRILGIASLDPSIAHFIYL